MCHIYIFHVYFNIRRRLRAVVESLGVSPNSTHLWEIGLTSGHRMSLVLCFHLFDKKGWTSWLWHSLSALRNSVILNFMPKLISVQFSCSVVSNSLWPHEPQHARPPFVHHQLPESAQTHVHWVSDAIQPSHPLSSLSPAFNLSKHQGLFKWVSSLNQVAKILEFQLQYQSFQWTPRTDFL